MDSSHLFPSHKERRTRKLRAIAACAIIALFAGGGLVYFPASVAAQAGNPAFVKERQAGTGVDDLDITT